jgi:cytochrome c-type biogenesis protein CcmH/NrfF
MTNCNYILALIFSIIPFYSIADEMETRHEIYAQIKCPTCIAQSIKESDTTASTYIRSYVDNRISLGEHPDKILHDISCFYGSNILLSNNSSSSLIVIILPVAFILLALFLNRHYLKKLFRTN